MIPAPAAAVAVIPSHPLLAVEIRQPPDVVLCRQRARQVAELLGFGPPAQTGVATAVSEIARNALRYAGRGRCEFSLVPADPATGRGDGGGAMLVVRVSDRGPGIPNLDRILLGQYESATGMGIGLTGSRRLSDRFDIVSAPDTGTVVTLGTRLPDAAPPVTPQLLAAVAADLARERPQTLLEEAQQQNRELLRTMDELRARQDEVERLNAELAETNRGVLALYAELDEKAESLGRASESKSRFLSDMSHELRTPLNAVVSLTGLLLDRTDGDLTPEQERQVHLVRKSAVHMTEMVGDLLDLAKIEAGKIDLRMSAVDAADVLAAIRGIFRPLVPPDGPVRFIVDDPLPGVPTLVSDEGKLSQILRNLVSNALKFTERGEVRVRVEHEPAGDGDGGATVRFRVVDTGIGIAPDDLPRVFADFEQVDNAIQRRVRGTGLGLPLSRKLARLLGGDVTAESRLGVGSTFSVVVPVGGPPGWAPPAAANAAVAERDGRSSPSAGAPA